MLSLLFSNQSNPYDKIPNSLQVDSSEAMELVFKSLSIYPPGTVLRWDKILELVNKVIEPNPPEDPDPLRILISSEDLKLTLVHIYESKLN